MNRLVRPLSAAAVALLLIVGGIFWALKQSAPSALSPPLTTPKLALEGLVPVRGKPLFFTPAAGSFLKEHWGEWGFTGTDSTLASSEGTASPTLSFDEAARENEAVFDNPKAWRALDRKRRFAAVLLCGEPATFRALLEHLSQSADWVLTDADPTSIVFQRAPAVAWTAEKSGRVRSQFARSSPSEQSLAFAQLAHRLQALGFLTEAEGFLKEALAKDSKSATALAGMAGLCAARFQWQEALKWTETALRIDSAFTPALATKANALLATGRANDALEVTEQLLKRQTEDGALLALHARVAHQARAHGKEIEALVKIIATSEKRGLPTGGWRVYLAQAYAANAQAEAALEQFERALKEPDITDSQRGFARKGIERIKDRKPIW